VVIRNERENAVVIVNAFVVIVNAFVVIVNAFVVMENVSKIILLVARF